MNLVSRGLGNGNIVTRGLGGSVGTQEYQKIWVDGNSELFEEKVKGRWRGRTPTNKLVFVESDDDLRGQILPVQTTWTGPWSMQARLTGRGGSVPLEVLTTSN